MRIVSTAPANTEILFALGVGDRVVGVTSLDDYPPEVADIDKVGDYQPNAEAVMALSPDLVVGYSMQRGGAGAHIESGRSRADLQPREHRAVSTTTSSRSERPPARFRGRLKLVESIKAKIKQVSDAAAATGETPKVFYAVDNTLWTCGPGSFVDELLTLANCTNVGSDRAPKALPPRTTTSSPPSNWWPPTPTSSFSPAPRATRARASSRPTPALPDSPR